MISAVRELGKLFLENEKKSTLSTLIENIDNERYPNMVCVVLSANDPYDFVDVILEETNAVIGEKYLYRKKSPNGPNFSPTAIVTETEKTYSNKFLGWFIALNKNKEIEKEHNDYFSKLRVSLERSQVQILRKVNDIITNPKAGWVLTLKLGEHYLLDIPQFKEYFIQSIFSKEEEISSTNQICSVCGQQKEKIYGGASPFKFYTIDKPGFISGGFNEKLSWRNFPVCSECYLALTEGKNVLKGYLAFRFYGLNYMLIPNFIFGKDSQKEIVNILINRSHKQITLSQRTEDNLTTYEDDILLSLAEAKDNVTFHFLFMQSQQSAERILLVIEDVLPSRLRTIFAAKKATDKLFPKAPFHLGKIRSFLGKSDPSKNNTDLDKYFLEVVNSIFQGRTVQFGFLGSQFMREIRREFLSSEKDQYAFKVYDAIQNTCFLSKLGLLERKEGICVNTIFDEVFDRYSIQLDTNKKRGIFLLGSLTRMLLRIQWKERKAQPFISQLKGLKMNERDILGLLPKVQNKLMEYSRFDKQKELLAKEITRLMLSSENKEDLTVDEMNFYFICGMNLSYEVSFILYGEKEKEEENNDGDE